MLLWGCDKNTSPLAFVGDSPMIRCVYKYTLGEADFWLFLDFQFPTVCNDGENNSKTQVEKVILR
jgi:hypothetical protein